MLYSNFKPLQHGRFSLSDISDLSVEWEKKQCCRERGAKNFFVRASRIQTEPWLVESPGWRGRGKRF